MKRRENFIWGFLLVVATILIFYIGIKTYSISKEVRAFKAEEAQDVQGADPQLLETVTNLEHELKDRLDYIFRTKKDPLKLSAVVKSPKLLASLGYNQLGEGEEDMRLNLTVIGENPYASIKFMGKFETVRIGDKIGGFKVLEIDAKKVVIRQGNKTVTLYNRPAPETLAEEAQLTGEAWTDNY